MHTLLAVLMLVTSPPPGGHRLELPAPEVVVYTTTVTIPTYPYAAYLYTLHSETYNMDYRWLNWSAYLGSNPQPWPQDYAAVVMENGWLRLTFLPELGGRLYGIRWKPTGEELLYQNPVLKPTHWGPPEQGWWLAAGGIEWCLPVEEHGYEWGVPWSAVAAVAPEGASITLRDTSASDRVRAVIRVYLPADRAVLTITQRLENPTGSAVRLRYWQNAMLAPGAANSVGPELRFVVPVTDVTVHSRGDVHLPGPGEAMSWPVYNGVDFGRLGNWYQWLGFFARPQAEQDWAGVYDSAARQGVARVFPHVTARGVKGFGMGWGLPIHWSNWTDDGSTYVELHGGPSPTFWDSIELSAGQSVEWAESWLPIRNLPALTAATSSAALGIGLEGSALWLGVEVAGRQEGLDVRMWQKQGCGLVWQREGLSLAPGETYSELVSGTDLGPSEVVFGALAGGHLLVATGPLTCLSPASEVEPLEGVQTTLQFPVKWHAVDRGRGVADYDVQVRDGDADAPWADWLTHTSTTSALFHGEEGHTYTFRSRTRDGFGNQEGWPTGRWQDSATTILPEPAPVLITSEKTAHPMWVQPGDPIRFLIRATNTGNLPASVVISDPLPAELRLLSEPWSSEPPAPVVVGGTIVWQGEVDAGGAAVVLGFDAQAAGWPPAADLTNTAWIYDGVDTTVTRRVTVWRGARLLFPAGLRGLQNQRK